MEDAKLTDQSWTKERKADEMQVQWEENKGRVNIFD